MLSNIKLPALVLGLSLFTSTVTGIPTGKSTTDTLEAPINGTVIENALHDLKTRQNGGFFGITGYQDGKIQPRLEVGQMAANKPNQFHLLLLGMRAFEDMPQAQKNSYFDIAAIHGQPAVAWDGVGRCDGCSNTGYCPHGIIIFPTWHRVYMALFEQLFMSIVNQIANSFDDTHKNGAPSPRDYMKGAASTMRFPYWDWAATPSNPNGDTVLSTLMSDKYVTVGEPDGSQRKMINPLFRFDFQDTSMMPYQDFVDRKTTIRHPMNGNKDTPSNEPQAVSDVQSILNNQQSNVYQLLTACHDFTPFSNQNSGGSSAACAGSLEGIHNEIHTHTGGPSPPNSNKLGGHMYWLELAAYDPIFWLHHGNVDRIFAMWQALNPNAMNSGWSQISPVSTFAINSNTTMDTNSALTPFHKNSNGDFWTSNDVQDTHTFGYTYPEFVDGASVRRGGNVQDDINSYVNALYGPQHTMTAGQVKRTAAATPAQAFDAAPTGAPLAPIMGSVGAAASELLQTPFIAGNGSSFQYVANVHAPKNALNGPYQVYMFDGAPASEDPSEWSSDPNKIGSTSVLGMPNMQHEDFMITSSVPLTNALTKDVHDGCLKDMSYSSVDEHLREKFQWRVRGPDGCAVDPSTIPNFEVGVFASTTSPIASLLELPSWSAFYEMTDVTSNKPGGATFDGNMLSLHRAQRDGTPSS